MSIVSNNPLDESEIEEKVIKIVAETLNFDQNKISKQSNFADDLKADSLDQVELIMAIEEAFGFDVPEHYNNKINTIADAVNFIMDMQKAKEHQE